jgi:hypothetical protein
VISDTSEVRNRAAFFLHVSPDFSLLLINMPDGSEFLCPRFNVPLLRKRFTPELFSGGLMTNVECQMTKE